VILQRTNEAQFPDNRRITCLHRGAATRLRYSPAKINARTRVKPQHPETRPRQGRPGFSIFILDLRARALYLILFPIATDLRSALGYYVHAAALPRLKSHRVSDRERLVASPTTRHSSTFPLRLHRAASFTVENVTYAEM